MRRRLESSRRGRLVLAVDERLNGRHAVYHEQNRESHGNGLHESLSHLDTYTLGEKKTYRRRKE